MGDVVDLHEARESRRSHPHVVINCNKVAVPRIHVYPRAYFEDLAAGKEGLEPLPPEVLRAIVHDWLVYMDAE
jgi:hypothetical protein